MPQIMYNHVSWHLTQEKKLLLLICGFLMFYIVFTTEVGVIDNNDLILYESKNTEYII